MDKGGPFWQRVSSDPSPGRGDGLGLPAARRVYVNQGGDSRALAGESDLEASRALQSITEMCMLAGHALRSEGLGLPGERRSTDW